MNFPQLAPKQYLPVGIALLLIAIGLGFYSYTQHRMVASIETESDKAVEQFLNNDAAQNNDSGKQVNLTLNNVEFHWSDNVFLYISKINALASPAFKNGVVNFDNLSSFNVTLGKAKVQILPSVLEGMFNESIFNYPESKLRDLSLELVKFKEQHRIKLSGNINYVLWIPFEMVANLTIDKKTNTLVMTVETLEILGVLPAKFLMDLKPFNMDKILSVPQNSHLIFDKNRILIKPFGLFPAPRINGKFSTLQMTPTHLVIGFEGDNQKPASNQLPKNGIYLTYGKIKFLNLTMSNTSMRLIDQNQKTPFVFAVNRYQSLLPNSVIKINQGQPLTVTMPDAQIEK